MFSTFVNDLTSDAPQLKMLMYSDESVQDLIDGLGPEFDEKLILAPPSPPKKGKAAKPPPKPPKQPKKRKFFSESE